MLQCDFSYMISPGMFERFVMPDLETCCAELDFAFYHLDGKGEIPHLDQLLSIDRLRGIQWIPGDGQPPPEEWLELLSRIRQGGKLVQLYVSAKGALKIIREFGGKGFAMYIMDRMSATEAKDYLKQVEEAGRSFIARRGN
jgi:5-methyltetrahydrofolate--homocysteine methyltransferase